MADMMMYLVFLMPSRYRLLIWPMDWDVTKVEVTTFDQLKFALAAYNDANRQSNRMWSAAALLAVFIFASEFGVGDQSFLGLKLGSEFVLPAALIVVSGFNISYAVAHVSAYRIAAVYQSIVRTHFDRDIAVTDEFSWFDLAQRAPVSNFNRLYPLLLPIEKNIGKGFYQTIKTMYDILFCGFPAFSIVYGLSSLSQEAPLYGLTMLVGAISIVATAFLMRWVVKWPKLGSN